MKVSIPIRLVEVEQGGCHILVKCRLNKELKGHFIIDTGASMTVIDKRLAGTYIDLSESPAEIHSSGITSQPLEVLTGKLEEMKIGKFVIQDFPVVMIDLEHINNLYRQFSDKQILGLLGGDFLKEHQAVIRYGNKDMQINIVQKRKNEKNKKPSNLVRRSGRKTTARK